MGEGARGARTWANVRRDGPARRIAAPRPMPESTSAAACSRSQDASTTCSFARDLAYEVPGASSDAVARLRETNDKLHSASISGNSGRSLWTTGDNPVFIGDFMCLKNNGTEFDGLTRSVPLLRQVALRSGRSRPDFIRHCIEERGCRPRCAIGEHMGIRSTNGVNDHLRALERKAICARRHEEPCAKLVEQALPSRRAAPTTTPWSRSVLAALPPAYRSWRRSSIDERACRPHDGPRRQDVRVR
jgi:hypothetical protein